MTDEAATLLRRAAQFHRHGQRREAIAVYRRLLALMPEHTDCWYELGYLLKGEGQYDEALAAYGEALARGVGEPAEVHLNRAVIYSDHLRQDQAAERELRAALAIDPDYLPALLNLGNLLEERGQREDALATYDRILSGGDQPGDDRQKALRSEALARVAQLRKPGDADDPLLQQLETAAADVALDHATRANLLFSLGRARDALGHYDHAFAAFAAANRHARQTGPAYSRVRARRLTDALIATFSRPAAGDLHDAAPVGIEPLFICGLFRSGSTLLEQVLATHQGVIAGGEIDFLPRLVRGPLAPFPASVATLDEQRLAALADDYLAHLQHLFPDSRRAGAIITDKRPDNFLLIGLIKRLFPKARIIHTVRNPLDNGFSIFMQHLDQRAMRYSSDLGDIGHYYGQYRRLMAHWKRLYGESILDFDYDAFVRAPRPTLEGLLAFLGLEWEERCLDFHRLGNTVKTASYWQVRRPLYHEASGRWRSYEAHLSPLVAALQEAGIPESEWRG
ncbi:MAG TPA: sulfotransferase [Gammaproteobacteria bacterium]|nr:sulfotransferase [Gammaproteobacteria bacterium]